MPPSSKNSFEKYAGALPAFLSQEEISTWLRGLRDEDTDSVPDTAEETAKKRALIPSDLS